MRRDFKSRYIYLILSLFLMVGVFLPGGGALAEETAKKVEKYTIDLNVNINDSDVLDKVKDKIVIKPSERQVKVYKLKVDKERSDDARLKLARTYDGKTISETEKDLKKQIEKVIEPGGSKLHYKNKLYDQIEPEVVNEFDIKELSELIRISDLDAGYYLIKETDASKKIPNKKLVTQVVKLPNKDMKENTLNINAKVTEDTPKDYIKLIKVDAINKDKKLDNAEFQLYKKGVDGKKDEPVKLTGEKGVYYRDDEKGDAIALKTWNGGEIIVYNLEKKVEYYFKELKPAPGYPNEGNVNKTSKNLKLGGSDTVENHRIPILKKVDADNGKALDGVEFEVYKKADDKKLNFKKTDVGYEVDPNGKDKLVTKNGGIINITNLENGKYYFKEVVALKGYIKIENKIDFEIKNFNSVNKDGKVEIVTVKNKPEKPEEPGIPTGGYHFVKIDSSKKENRLAGAKFVLMKKEGSNYKEFLKDGKRITLTSPDNGEFSIDGLEYGDYALKEIEAPKNHTISQELTPFTVDAASNLEPAKKIVNEPYVPTTVTSKENTITTRHVPGEITRIVKNPLVKTGDIRIVVMAIIGIILTIMGMRFVNSSERKQRI